MKKIKNKKLILANIAEGTHAGSITLKAAEDIDSAYLLVCLDDTGNAINICQAEEMPIGVCTDECDINENVSVALAGSAESTFLCRCATDIDAGQTLYSTSGGKVSNVANGVCYKIGIALTSAQEGSLVEVDTQGFGTRALQIADGGIYIWSSSGTEESMPHPSVLEGDAVIATVATSTNGEKLVSATAQDNAIKFTLDNEGTAQTTKISWLIVNK